MLAYTLIITLFILVIHLGLKLWLRINLLKKEQQNFHQMVKCAECGRYVAIEDAKKINKQYYCCY